MLYSQLSLGPDGYLYPCSELVNDRFKICHITEQEKLKEIVHQFRAQTGFGLPIIQEICPNCPIKYLCNGGCRTVDLFSGENYFKAPANGLICNIFLLSIFNVLWKPTDYKLNTKIFNKFVLFRQNFKGGI